jgi:hypothetical protein
MKKMGGTRRWQMSVLVGRRTDAVCREDIEKNTTMLLPCIRDGMTESDAGWWVEIARDVG